jgi:hypothetical protein
MYQWVTLHCYMLEQKLGRAGRARGETGPGRGVAAATPGGVPPPRVGCRRRRHWGEWEPGRLPIKKYPAYGERLWRDVNFYRFQEDYHGRESGFIFLLPIFPRI